MTSATHIIAQTDQVILRDILPSDVEHYLRWQTTGEWRYLDAPWEGIHETFTEQQAQEYRQKLLAFCQQVRSQPQKGATISLPSNQPIGSVNRYKQERFPGVWYVGIGIRDDAYLNRGLGTQALKLWIGYLFDNSDIHKIGLHTWSFNPRMMHIAQKIGFTYEGAERHLINWQGQWLDREMYGLLRDEYAG